jgi:hypothetical protein|tara:strand:+ start:1225 stop:1362 length:138 start_codon:yes stop_codon:yes gene_type:complete
MDKKINLTALERVTLLIALGFMIEAEQGYIKDCFDYNKLLNKLKD